MSVANQQSLKRVQTKPIFVLLLMAASLAAQAQSAGEVEFSKGVGFAQMPGQMPRTLGKGLPLHEGDRLTIADGSAAIIKLNDGTRMTLRPNSEMVVQQYQYKDGSAQNSMVMQLLRGGFRAITGMITKNAPNAAKIQTNTATVGIRGTDFDARVCGAECKEESSKITETAKPNTIAASAKLVSSEGDISATDLTKAKRTLVDGGSVYPGETIDVGPKAKGVLIFRDDSRITLGANTRFKVDSFVYDTKNPTEGNFLVSLLRGSLRALTGQIGKSNNRNVRFITPTATVGIRGTGLDMDCGAVENASGSCSFYTWQGSIEVAPLGQDVLKNLQTLHAGQGMFVSRTTTRPLTAPTLENMQRPDTVPVKVQELFGKSNAPTDEKGLYVFVRDGHVEITSSKETLHLGRGETGFAANDGQTGRPANMPLFIQFDKVPMPNTPNPTLLSLVGQSSKPASNQCK